ncbi:MAG: family 20 glycosylhydrolase, partial [Muribaculaceae bacterium]|nr:family 20 glycosylhydrolase [Muribaculaceae bacterium]
MTIKNVFASCIMISAALTALAAPTPDLPLIPQPKSVDWIEEEYIVPKDTVPRIRINAETFTATAPEEGYELTVTPKGITIAANDSRGAVWARQTLRQLRRPDGSYPHVRIIDSPEFPIRGFLYDAGRNFADTSIIKEYINLMSAYKLNTFQWHITDKPAWRIECKAFHRLNAGKFQRPGRDHGKFY